MFHRKTRTGPFTLFVIKIPYHRYDFLKDKHKLTRDSVFCKSTIKKFEILQEFDLESMMPKLLHSCDLRVGLDIFAKKIKAALDQRLLHN
jgi:hypothetical protein